ncbi:MAG: HD domain-containing protein [Bacteroidetes bacterium]|nr:HD domain-containing protein [Bacteroidota bacterium]MBU1720122.1 HD domain-containing protein [Bacteroidota bacterium]
MNKNLRNKRKILNDPVYGFINIPDDIIFDLIEHRYFQRLRRILQLGLTNLVYPGALHTRFHHALGAMHLMGEAVNAIRSKGHRISTEEALAANIAILLHDIGHGPYSHTLEHSLVHGITHEDISETFMGLLNREFNNELELAISIFNNTYKKGFLHQLVSGQLDTDRLDYLRRDSFFTGVSEGVISTDRLIKMLNVNDDELVIEEKGVYSAERFITARRLMYWQVYFHKTVISAESLLLKILQRAKYLTLQGEILFASPSLQVFLKNNITKEEFTRNLEYVEHFSELDDFDILAAIKVWQKHHDFILSELSKRLVNRQLFRVEILRAPVEEAVIAEKKEQVAKKLNISIADADYFAFSGEIANNAYTPGKDRIGVLMKSGEVLDITEASDQIGLELMAKTIRKFYYCYPKEG